MISPSSKTSVHTTTFTDAEMTLRYVILHKPYGVLSQFTPDIPGQRTLADQQIRLVALDGVAPTADNLASGKYPVRRPLYLTYLKDGAKVKPAIKAFLDFVRTPEGQQIIRDNS